jgi:type I restriction enzyme S subunit
VINSLLIKEFAKVKGGKRLPKGQTYVDSKTEHPYLRVTDFGKNTIKESDLKYISKETHEAIKRYIISKEDIYISIAGTIGRVGWIPEQLDGANLTENAAKITEIKGYNNRFLVYYLSSSLAQKQISENTKSTSQPKLALYRIEGINVPLFPLPIQRAIVTKIENLFASLDKGIADLKKAQEQLKVYRQAVLKKALEGDLTKEWREQNPNSEKDLVQLLEYIEDFNANKSGQDIPRRLPPIDLSDLHELPYGWIWQEAHKICSSVRDGTHDTPKYVDEGVPLVTSKNLKNGEIDMDNVDLISESDHEEICCRSTVEENDILYGMIGTIGNPVIVKQTNAFSIKNVGLFKKNETLLIPKYFQYYLSSWVVEHIMRQKELIRGTTQKFVALGGLRVLPIPLPSKKEQKQIIKEIESRLSICDKVEQSITEGLEKSEALRQSILKKAFEGKLLSEAEIEKCKQEADYEPASVLLEKIKKEKKK